MVSTSPNTRYTISAAQKRTGLTGRQIRYYESQGLLTPERTQGNQRRFSDSDILQLLRIKELMEKNLDIQTVKQLLLENPESESGDRSGPSAFPRTGENIQDVLGHRLSSLYPVSNRVELLSLLDSIVVKKAQE